VALLPFRWTKKAALNIADFECFTRCGTFRISAAFSVQRDLRAEPHKSVKQAHRTPQSLNSDGEGILLARLVGNLKELDFDSSQDRGGSRYLPSRAWRYHTLFKCHWPLSPAFFLEISPIFAFSGFSNMGGPRIGPDFS